MELLPLCLSLMTVVLAWAAFQAWRLRNERRDVWLIGASSGVAGLGASLAHWL